MSATQHYNADDHADDNHADDHADDNADDHANADHGDAERKQDDLKQLEAKVLLALKTKRLQKELKAELELEKEEIAAATSKAKSSPFTPTPFSKSKVFNEVFTYQEPRANLTERSIFGATLRGLDRMSLGGIKPNVPTVVSSASKTILKKLSTELIEDPLDSQDPHDCFKWIAKIMFFKSHGRFECPTTKFITPARRIKFEEFVDEKYSGMDYDIEDMYVDMKSDRFGKCLFTQDFVSSVIDQQYIEPKDYLRHKYLKPSKEHVAALIDK